VTDNQPIGLSTGFAQHNDIGEVGFLASLNELVYAMISSINRLCIRDAKLHFL
jgi:hypothetical protein